MNKQQAIELLDKYLKGECSPEECLLLHQAYNKEIPGEGAEPAIEDYEASYQLVLSRLEQRNPRIRIVRRLDKTRQTIIWTVAAAVATIIFGVWFFRADKQMPNRSQDIAMYKHNIAPGKNTATLTLANGRTIQLSDTKKGVVIADDLKYDDNTAVVPGSANKMPDAKVMMLTANTPQGGTYTITLPDGTRIWLNADSKITFPSRFTGRKREVSLTGEAYFEVAHNKAKPFIVESKGQKVEVLGTHFNINSYADEPVTKTTLLEGSVKVNNVLLQPNQQATLQNDNRIAVQAIDPSVAVAWKDGIFKYKNTSLEEVMRQIARWYVVEISYESASLKVKHLSGSVSRSDQIGNVLKAIENTGAARFKIERNKIIVVK